MGNNSCVDCSRRYQPIQRKDQLFEGILEQECVLWDIVQKRFLRTKFFVTQPKNNKIYYISDSGSIMRIQQISCQQLQQSEILTNIEQIKCLKWIGQCGNNQQKIGSWKAFWQGEALVGVGGIYSRKKQNLIQKYYTQRMEKNKDNGINHSKISPSNFKCMKVEIIQMIRKQNNGNTLSDLKKCLLFKYVSGGGLYDYQGKQGQWIELINNFSVQRQITLNGDYKNGQKVGRWDIYHRRRINKQFELICGGSYDNQEGSDSFKIGEWQEPSDGFHNDNQVMYAGEYKNGIKVGKWEIQKILDDYGLIKNIGDGKYDDEQKGDNRIGIKQGKWHELSELLQNSSQVTYYGEYKNGIKIGRWEIYWKQNNENSFKLIGGGLYLDKLVDQYLCGIKQGRWVELSEGFRNSSQLTWKGDYQNNNKVGRWNIRFEWENIGGGSYDEDEVGLTIKVGTWIELSDKFDRNNQLIYKGEYKDGKKVGRWHIQWREHKFKQGYEEIGGGYYHEEGSAVKIGRWIDLDDGFYCKKQVTYHGEYQNGKKVRRWNTCWTNGIQIGGGCYDEEGDGNKIGKWIDLSDRYMISQSQVIYSGEYQNGKKVGKWTIFHWNDEMNNYQQIGGGLYDKRSGGIKIGKWIDLDDGYDQEIQIIYYGEYKYGKKVGIWDIMYRQKSQAFKLIGGGSYDNNGDGIKIGKWIEIDEEFNLDEFVQENGYKTNHGNYKNGKKVGIWIVFQNFKKIAKIQYQN